MILANPSWLVPTTALLLAWSLLPQQAAADDATAKTTHVELTDQLEKLRKKAQDFEVADGLTSFIQTWLVDHVNNFDREFVGHFLDKGIDPHA